LCDGGETTVLHLGGVEGHGVLRELEALLDERGEFADAATLLAEDFLSVGCADYWRARSVSRFFDRNEDIGSARDILISVTVGVTRTSTPE